MYKLFNIFLLSRCNRKICALSLDWLFIFVYIYKCSLSIVTYCCSILHYKKLIWFLYRDKLSSSYILELRPFDVYG